MAYRSLSAAKGLIGNMEMSVLNQSLAVVNEVDYRTVFVFRRRNRGRGQLAD